MRRDFISAPTLKQSIKMRLLLTHRSVRNITVRTDIYDAYAKDDLEALALHAEMHTWLGAMLTLSLYTLAHAWS